jgi:hypothetical protein
VINLEVSFGSLVELAQGGGGGRIHIKTGGGDGVGSVYHIKPLLIDGE